jgi:hypothetical protein
MSTRPRPRTLAGLTTLLILVTAGCGRLADTRGLGGPEPAPSNSTLDQLVISQDRAKQSDLRNGLAAAKTYFTDDDTYRGFDEGCAATPSSCSVAESIEPSLDWRSVAARADEVIAITLVTATDVVLTGISLSGEEFCMADTAASSEGTVRGRGRGAATAATFEACSALGPQGW